MKQFFTILLLLLISALLWAQAPQKMSYQAVVRDNSSVLITEQGIGMQVSILQGTFDGTIVYQETHEPTTNINGLVSIEIGDGTTSDDFSVIDWSDGPYFIKTKIDPTSLGGTSYTIEGVSQLLGVPYAYYANTAGNVFSGSYTDLTDVPVNMDIDATDDFSGDYEDLLNQPDFTGWDTDVTNEIQDLELNGSTLTITNNAAATEIDLSPFIDINTDEQTLSVVGDELSITNGNTVTLPDGSVWTNQNDTIFYNNGLVGINTNLDYIDARLKVEDNDPSDTTVTIYAHGYSGVAVKGKIIAQTDVDYFNLGVSGELQTEASTSGRAVNGNVYGIGSGGNGVWGEAHTETGWNTGVSGSALSMNGNTNTQTGGSFRARGDWNPANGVGTGDHYGVMAEANGGGSWNTGVWAQAKGSSPTGNNYGGQFFGFSDVQTTGYHNGIRAEADSSSYVNRGVVGLTNSKGQYNQGGFFQADGEGNPTGGRNSGVEGWASNNMHANYGVLGVAQISAPNDTAFVAGVYGQAAGSKYSNYGVYGSAYSDDLGDGYVTGVYGEASSWSDAKVSSHGVDGTTASKAKKNVGVGAYAYGDVSQDSINMAFYGYVANADTNYSVYADATYDGQVNYGLYAEAANGTVANYSGFFEGDVVITGNLDVTGAISKGSGTFKIDHPLDPENKYLVHSFVESPDMMNVYSGNITTDADGFAIVTLPDYFEVANKDFRYQLTCIGTFAQAIVKEEIANNKFIVQTSEPNVKISWQVTSVRNDKYAQENRIESEQVKKNSEKGKYLHPELYGKSINDRVYPRSTGVSDEIIKRKFADGNREKIEDSNLKEPSAPKIIEKDQNEHIEKSK